jgi:hypothetical protein
MLSKNDLKNAVSEALNKLLHEDGSLFVCPIEEEFPYDARKLHEVCINHKLANHLEAVVLPLTTSLGKMFVDIEFNREGLNFKQVQSGNESKKVRPDIIIHNRRSDQNKKNLLVVECKKEDAEASAIGQDKEKIFDLIKDEKYSYSFGLQVVYGTGKIESTLYFNNNGQIDSESLQTITNQNPLTV